MKLVSVNVGLPREVFWKGKTVTTSIFKDPVQGAVMLRMLNLEGDRQADLSAHGGSDKAVYAYAAEHYDYWRQQLPHVSFSPGMFGENLTLEGLNELEVRIGDRYRIGNAELAVTQPRLPCYKLALRFQRDDMIKRFLASSRTGFYLSVSKEGQVCAGDRVELIQREEDILYVCDVTRLYLTKKYTKDDFELLQRAIHLEALPSSWRDYFLGRSSKNETSDELVSELL